MVSLRAAADQLGVHYMTAYRYVRTGRLPARNMGGRWEIDERELARLAAETASPGRRGEPDWERTQRRMIARLLAGDEAGAWSIVEDVIARGSAPWRVHLEVLAPCMRRIGELWARDEVSVAEEHLAAAVALRIVARLGPRFRPRGQRSTVVVVAGVEGDNHVLPVAMLADLLRGDGLRVVDLGANAPTSSVLDTLSSHRDVEVLCLSVSIADRFGVAKSTVSAVRAHCPDLLILVGGPAVDSYETAVGLGSNGFETDGRAAAATIRRLARRRDARGAR